MIFDVAQVVPSPSSSAQPGSQGHLADSGFVTSKLYCRYTYAHTIELVKMHYFKVLQPDVTYSLAVWSVESKCRANKRKNQTQAHVGSARWKVLRVRVAVELYSTTWG